LNCGKRKAAKKANAFSPDEVERIIKDFQDSYDYGCYAPLVIFLFKTGCRPSEALGLQWKHVSEDCSKVMFRGSVQLIDNAPVWVEGSKNNKTRDLNIGQSLTAILLSLKDENPNDDDPVFPSPRTGRFIHYNNFVRRAWRSIVDPIKRDTTPYCCRDTFITEQLLKGVPSAVIAKWCDTSVKVIESTYAYQLRLSTMRPID
jgi:integrase